MQLNSLTEDKTMDNNLTIQQIQTNVRIALEAVMGDASPEMLDEMSSIFLEDAIPLIQQMKDGFTTHDFNSITVAAHTLKGSSATIGLDKFANLCLAIEQGSKVQESGKLGSFINSLETEYAHIEEALRHFLL